MVFEARNGENEGRIRPILSWYASTSSLYHLAKYSDFKSGPWSCVGKQLALIELRTVVALLVTELDVKFATGEDGSALLNESKDYFTISLSHLNLIFSPKGTNA